jgi:hypothetical protein
MLLVTVSNNRVAVLECSSAVRQCFLMLQETTWTVPEAVAVKADALKLTPEKAAIVRMLKANKMVAANLRADLRGGYAEVFS